MSETYWLSPRGFMWHRMPADRELMDCGREIGNKRQGEPQEGATLCGQCFPGQPGISKADARFASKVERDESGCHVWTGGQFKDGYGRFWVDGKSRLAHRWAWERVNGPVPDGLELLHECDNPPCVNLAHLRPGTHFENMRDQVKRGRHVGSKKTHCLRGHPFDGENTYRRNGQRKCKTCRAMADARYKARRRGEAA